MDELLQAVAADFEGKEPIRQFILNRTPFFWK